MGRRKREQNNVPTESERDYDEAREEALSFLEGPFDLDGRPVDRASLHERN